MDFQTYAHQHTTSQRTQAAAASAERARVHAERQDQAAVILCLSHNPAAPKLLERLRSWVSWKGTQSATGRPQ
ncbi:hypothetical protein G7066_12370 [Leucobacter coleopterorum]|uniref:Uncharacterized protein n=1 Tax=Leucobacter coleopterorum TaxID=2714933 RepID=A0ABX6JXW6_9MICO|nr:hypothetical protein [Leucobacter coleopterorum]QIM19164.1 hypothetical protein G7066_12370 [Leucobacter coleopterorum]